MRADVPMGMAHALQVPKDRCVPQQQQWGSRNNTDAPSRRAAPQTRLNLRNPPGEFTHFPNVRVLQFCKCAGFAILHQFAGNVRVLQFCTQNVRKCAGSAILQCAGFAILQMCGFCNFSGQNVRVLQFSRKKTSMQKRYITVTPDFRPTALNWALFSLDARAHHSIGV